MPEQIVRVQMDARAAMKDLRGIQYEQFPYAYAKALTRTAKLAQHAVRTQTRLEFHLHTEYIPRGIMVEFAKKREITQFGTTSSAVFTSRAITPFMAWHETGGTKRPRGSMLTIPGAHFRPSQYKTSTGRVKKRWQPKIMLNKPSPKRSVRKKGRITKRPFIIEGRGTKPPLIVQRVRPGKRGLHVIYTMQRSAVIDPRWDFENTVRRTADRFFTKVFGQEFDKAMATAK